MPESAGALTALNHPAFILLLIAAMLGTTALAPLLSYRADQYWLRSAENVKEGNRFFGFAFSLVGLSKNWLDVRTYRQERYIAPIINVLIDKLCTPGSWIARRGRGAMGLLMAASASISHLFTALVYGFVCLKAYGGAFGIGSGHAVHRRHHLALRRSFRAAASVGHSAQQCRVPARHL